MVSGSGKGRSIDVWLYVQTNEIDNAAAEEKEPEYGVHLDIASYGDISSFFWAHSQAPPPGLVECNVAYGMLVLLTDLMAAFLGVSIILQHGIEQ